jgi:hypothetical protein
MHCFVLWMSLVVGGNAYDDGSLLFLENCNSVVQWTGDGNIGHVALIFNDSSGKPWVYEATPGRLRRVTLEQYQQELARINGRRDDDDGIRGLVLRPKRPYSADETTAMLEYLDQQVGRRYSVRNYVRDNPGDGMHCAELTSSTLNRSGRHAFERCSKIHPAELYELVAATHGPIESLDLDVTLPQLTWCQRASLRWSESWTWCKWSCGEAWAWCW